MSRILSVLFGVVLPLIPALPVITQQGLSAREGVGIYRVSLDDCDYGFLYKSMGEERMNAAILRFHEAFRRARDTFYREWEIEAPVRFTVLIAENASIFGEATGQNWHTASLYDPRSDRFYFQNPESLNRLHLLDKSILHEICHQAIGNSRAGTGANELWIEESFCEAVSADRVGLTRADGERLKGVKRLGMFAEFVEREIGSGVKARQNRAYRIAADFSNFLMRELGRAQTLRLVVTIRSGSREWSGAEALYLRYYESVTAR
jgi:hypothetical protein